MQSPPGYPLPPYGQVPQQPSQQQPWGAPPGPGMVPPGPFGMMRTCAGVPLEPGERVLYFRTHDHMASRMGSIIVGIITIPFLIGIIILINVFTAIPKEDKAQVVTSRRLFSVNGSGTLLLNVRWEELQGFTKIIFNNRPNQFAVKLGNGQVHAFLEDAMHLERMLPALHAHPQMREQAPEVTFLPTV